jgi:hypothetical protein
MSVAEALSGEVQIQVMAEAAAGSSAKSDQGCSDSLKCEAARGRHQRWGAGGCWSAALVRDGCVTFATGLMGRWRVALRGERCCAGQ